MYIYIYIYIKHTTYPWDVTHAQFLVENNHKFLFVLNIIKLKVHSLKRNIALKLYNEGK